MDNPCKYCEKANIDYINDCEYGCDTPCEKAKDFFRTINKKLDNLLEQVKRLIKEGENHAE